MPKYVIYCDGACSGNPGPGGWGSIVINLETQMVKELSGGEPQTTNNRMELSAALISLQSLPSPSQVTVLTDSVYMIRGVTEWIHGWRRRGWKTAEGQAVLNQDLWELLDLENRRHKVEWRYVRGHQGTPGNERVDAIAVEERDGNFPHLFQGKLSDYGVLVIPLPPFQEIPKSSGNGEKKQVLCYVSLIGGVVEKHSSWKDCEARVKGRSGAKFKKVHSQEELNQLLKEWGL